MASERDYDAVTVAAGSSRAAYTRVLANPAAAATTATAPTVAAGATVGRSRDRGSAATAACAALG
jgi:hypothetical protein